MPEEAPSMRNDLGYGPRISGEEYDRRIIALHRDLPPVPGRDEEVAVRRKELDLAIDHRLGLDFPRDKREALWAIQERIEKKRGRLILKHLLGKLFSRGLVQDAQDLSRYLVKEYEKVLSQKELECFFGREEVRNPGLPVDLEHLKK